MKNLKVLLSIVLLATAPVAAIANQSTFKANLGIFCLDPEKAAQLTYVIGNGGEVDTKVAANNGCYNAKGTIPIVGVLNEPVLSVITKNGVYVIIRVRDAEGDEVYGVFPSDYPFYGEDKKGFVTI